MPRSVSKNMKDEEAKRLKDLRLLLGLSQRDLAQRFNVAHGAIAQWEKGERTIPGPVLRLMDIYEENLGMIDQKKNSLKKIRSSWMSRTLQTSATTAKLSAKLAGSSLRQLIVGNEKASQIKTATEVALAQHLTETLGEMKGLVMKMGQMVSYMDFAMPEGARAILSALQDSTQPMAPEVIERIIEEEFGASPSSLFKKWSRLPMAAASIGQVHRAMLQDGTEVAIKIQYPDIAKSLDSDLTNIGILDKLGSALFRYQNKDSFMGELRERVLEECDYLREADHLELFRKLHAENSSVVIPRVYRDLTTKRVLTTEYIEGRKFQAFLSSASQEEKDEAGKVLFQMAFESLFKHGAFNCDPHPGNYLFLGNGGVAFLDFGCVRKFERSFMERWKSYARAVLEGDRKKADPLVVQLGIAPRPEKFDFDYHAKLMEVLYEPWFTEGGFRFNRHFVEQTWRVMISDNVNKFVTNVPREWIFTNRLQWGLYAVLAELGAKLDCRSIILDLLFAPGVPRPKGRK